MKVIDPSFKVYPTCGITEDEILKQIEFCGRVCYQSRDKITPDSAKKFVARVMSFGHDSVMEMANIIIMIDYPKQILPYLAACKYLQLTERKATSQGGPGGYLVSGSPRAFMEACTQCKFGLRHLSNFLAGQYPSLFWSLDNEYDQNFYHVIKSSSLSEEEIFKHHKVAVEFTVNRAFSHQIVRHRPPSYLQESQRYCRYGEDVTFIRPILKSRYASYNIWEQTMKICEDNYKALLKLESPQAARNVLPNSTATHIVCYASIEQWKHIFGQRCSNVCDPNMYIMMRQVRDEFEARHLDTVVSPA